MVYNAPAYEIKMRVDLTLSIFGLLIWFSLRLSGNLSRNVVKLSSTQRCYYTERAGTASRATEQP